MTTMIGRGLAARRVVLENSAVVISKEARTVPAVTIQVSFKAGSIYERDDELGLSNLTSRTLDRGTARRSTEDIAEALDARGVSLSLSANRHALTVTCTCLTEDFEAMLQLLGDIVIQPEFPADEVIKRKGELLNSIRQDDDSPSAQAVQAMFALLYPDAHPYGRPAKGRLQTVSGLDRDALQRFHRTRFAPSALTVVVVGDIDQTRAVDVSERVFGGWHVPPPGDITLPHPPTLVARQERIIPMMNKAQADIAYGFTTIVRSDPSYYAYTLMNNALGQYGIGGRLGDNIRENQGMAYYVFSSFDANVVEGPLFVRAGVNPNNVKRAIDAIDTEIRKMAADGLTAEELADCKLYLIGSIPRMLETNQAIAAFLHTAEFFGLGLDHDLRLPALLDAVTLDETNAAAQRTLDPARAAVVVAGPYER
jgi:zinc protease